MGRRSSHTSEELRELIINETTALVEQGGFASLSAREIARRIDYSPGTLYNVFQNLDDLVITIEGRLLDRLVATLDAAVGEVKAKGRKPLLGLLQAYLSFAQENQQLWRLLGEHRLTSNMQVPSWYQDKIKTIQARIGGLLSGLTAEGLTEDRIRSAAHGLWVVVHGIAGLSTGTKLNVLTAEAAREMLEDLVNTYLDGFTANRA